MDARHKTGHDGLACIQVHAHLREYIAKHLRRQHAGVGVVAGAVIAVEQHEIAHHACAAMGEWVISSPRGLRPYQCFVGNPAKRNDSAKPGHFTDGGSKEIAAGRYLKRRRLVFRRHAPHRVGDAAIDQREAIVGARLVTSLREAEVLQRGVEKIAGIVAGERPSGAVGAAQARSQPDDQKASVDRAELGDRCIEPVRLLLAPAVAEGDEARTARAIAAGFAARAG